MLQSYLLKQIREEPETVSRVEGEALRSLSSEINGQFIDSIVRQQYRKQPCLNLLEFLYPNDPCILTLSESQATHLSSQIPEYVTSHTSLNNRQSFAVVSALNHIGQHVAENPRNVELLKAPMACLTSLPDHVRQEVYWNISKLSEMPQIDPEGKRCLQAIGHACSCTLDEVPFGLDDNFDKEVFWSCVDKIKPGAAVKVMSGDPRALKDMAASKAVARTCCDAPVSADSMGGEVLQAFAQQLKTVEASNPKKSDAVGYVAEASKVLKSHRPLPKAFESMLKSLDINSPDWKDRLSQAIDKAKQPDAPINKLFTPKVKRKVKRDYIIIRDKEGRLLFQTYNARQVGKVALPQAEKPLTKPPTPDGKLVFENNPEATKLAQSLISEKMLTDVQKKGQTLTAKPSKNLEKKIIAKSNLASFKRALGQDIQMDVVEQDATELDI